MVVTAAGGLAVTRPLRVLSSYYRLGLVLAQLAMLRDAWLERLELLRREFLAKTVNTLLQYWGQQLERAWVWWGR